MMLVMLVMMLWVVDGMGEKVAQVAKLVVVVMADNNKRMKLAKMKLAMTTMWMAMTMIMVIGQKMMIFELVTLIVVVVVKIKAMILFETAGYQERYEYKKKNYLHLLLEDF
jgi:predicted exporter